ncbi:cyclase family protein [Serpentinicella sp. ANB-PHB4]|uniref:cyclase family protein n=1 Tax=Serpentinicella sp. ANB-PHB4 TaxID=3074076 RepID=UPI002F3FA764
MKTIDLSQYIYPGMPVYPGTEAPIFEQANTLEQDGFIEKKITFFSHTGTHMDAPAHIIKEGKTLDQFDVSQFLGEGMVLEVDNTRRATIDLDYISTFENRIKIIDFIILKTGWDQYWGNDQYFSQYPVLSPEAATWLANFTNLKGIGIDAISIDKEGDRMLTNHHIFLKNNIVIIENLTNLEPLINKSFLFSCLPMKIENADGSPIRAVGTVCLN